MVFKNSQGPALFIKSCTAELSSETACCLGLMGMFTFIYLSLVQHKYFAKTVGLVITSY